MSKEHSSSQESTITTPRNIRRLTQYSAAGSLALSTVSAGAAFMFGSRWGYSVDNVGFYLSTGLCTLSTVYSAWTMRRLQKGKFD